MEDMSRQGLEASGTGALRELVIEVLERMERDGSAALERACAEHPELAESLRARVESLRELGLVGDLVEGPGGRVGEFRLLERVGSGGMGVVYRARQASLDREVALKLIRPELLFDDETRERFARETSVVARLQHPGIVPIYTVGERGDQPWYAMELVVGCSLAEALREFSGRSVDELSGEDLRDAVCERSSSPRPAGLAPLFAGSWVESSLRVVRQAAEALAHAHQRGVLHRDVKASNLMLTPTGRVMLLDFGLSHVEGDDSLTRSGDRVGSVPYMPPELLRDGPRAVDRRSDVYGLGVILYELLTLHRPFAAEGVTELMAAILEGRPPRPSSYSPGLSWEQETVCLAALELDPRRRYATADDLARDLENVLERRPIQARRASSALALRRLVQRRPGAAAAVLLAVLMAVLLPTVIAFLSLREARNVGAALEKADEHRERALRAVDRMLYDVANARLAHVPQAHELRQNLYEDARELFEEMAVAEPDNGELRLMAVEAALGQATLLENEGRFAASEELLLGTLEDLVPWVARGASRRAARGPWR